MKASLGHVINILKNGLDRFMDAVVVDYFDAIIKYSHSNVKNKND